jgi:hypothetical protein
MTAIAPGDHITVVWNDRTISSGAIRWMHRDDQGQLLLSWRTVGGLEHATLIPPLQGLSVIIRPAHGGQPLVFNRVKEPTERSEQGLCKKARHAETLDRMLTEMLSDDAKVAESGC